MRSPKKIDWGIVMIIACIILLASCSTTSKIKTTVKTTVDSSSVTNIDSSNIKTVDSAVVKKDNTVSIKETDGTITKETIFEFADEDTTTKAATEWPWHPSTIIPAADFFPPIRTTGKLKKVTVRETGSIKTKETTNTNKQDSAHKITTENTNLVKSNATDVKKTTVAKEKQVERTSYWGWLWIGLISAAVIFVGWYFGLWQWLWAYLKRRKREEYLVTYKTKTNDRIKKSG